MSKYVIQLLHGGVREEFGAAGIGAAITEMERVGAPYGTDPQDRLSIMGTGGVDLFSAVGSTEGWDVRQLIDPSVIRAMDFNEE
jgi:hypothetical protein